MLQIAGTKRIALRENAQSTDRVSPERLQKFHSIYPENLFGVA
jgi:hypothetical protein